MANQVSFGGAAPIFPVADLAISIEYYTKKLGFHVNWEAAGFASVSRGRCTLFLCQGDQGHPGSWTWIGVSDAGQLFEEYQASGAKIRNPPTNYSWAYEMQIEDPDGNVLRFGSDSKKDKPFGLFPDMNGKRWPTS